METKGFPWSDPERLPKAEGILYTGVACPWCALALVKRQPEKLQLKVGFELSAQDTTLHLT